MEAFWVIVLGYLLGSIPTSQIVARWRRGIDLRQYGSGTPSGSMVYEYVGKLWVLPVGLFDIFKAAFPVWLAVDLGYGEIAAAAAGLVAVIGHNWSIFMNLQGGRGLGTFFGLLLVLFPWGFPWLLGFLAIGFVLGDSAPFALAGIASLPALVYWLDGPQAMYWATGGMLVITLAKRLEANHRPLPVTGPQRRQVIYLRLFFDRDIRDHQQWIKRTPPRNPKNS